MVEESPTTVQFSHSVLSDSLKTHKPQHARHPCPSPIPGSPPKPMSIDPTTREL